MDPNLSNDPREGEELAPRPATEEFGARKRTKAEPAMLSSFWFANNFHWGALLLILMPGDVSLMDPANRATTLAKLTSLGAVFALVVPLWAAVISDRSMNRLGRRRPFMALGTIVMRRAGVPLHRVDTTSDLVDTLLGVVAETRRRRS